MRIYNFKLDKNKMKRFFQWIYKLILWIVWDFSGIRFIWGKIYTPIDKETVKRKPITFFLWIFGIYIALFGVSSQRYENRIDIIENRANSIFSQMSTPFYKKALSRIPRVQKMPCPIKPDILHPISVFQSLFKNTTYTEMVELFKETIENWKDSLSYVNLCEIDLSKTDLYNSNFYGAYVGWANFTYAMLSGANFIGANLSGSDFRGAKLAGANLNNAILCGANLREAYLPGINITGANFAEADLRGIIIFGSAVEELSKVKTLYLAKIDPSILEEIKTKYPHLLEQPSDY